MALTVPIQKLETGLRNAIVVDRDRSRRVEVVERRRGVLGSTPVVAGTRIPTAAIWRLREAGYTTDRIFEDYPGLQPGDVEAAIAAEGQRRTDKVQVSLRFFVDQPVPYGVVRVLRSLGHDAWTAYEAGLPGALDETLIVYSASKSAIAVTTNKDFAALARRLRLARVGFLRVEEAKASEAVRRAVEWLEDQALPNGMVLRVPLTGGIEILSPQPLGMR